MERSRSPSQSSCDSWTLVDAEQEEEEQREQTEDHLCGVAAGRPPGGESNTSATETVSAANSDCDSLLASFCSSAESIYASGLLGELDEQSSAESGLLKSDVPLGPTVRVLVVAMLATSVASLFDTLSTASLPVQRETIPSVRNENCDCRCNCPPTPSLLRRLKVRQMEQQIAIAKLTRELDELLNFSQPLPEGNCRAGVGSPRTGAVVDGGEWIARRVKRRQKLRQKNSFAENENWLFLRQRTRNNLRGDGKRKGTRNDERNNWLFARHNLREMRRRGEQRRTSRDDANKPTC